MKRQRGRGRKPGGNPGNRPHESNGPEVKIRGTAAQIHEKYLQYARDAQSSGDRVRYENLMQHAEHYFRILAATMPKDRLPGQQQDNQQRSDDDGDTEDSNNEAEATASESEGEDQSKPEAAEASDEGGEGANRPRRRRGRRRSQQDGDSAEGDGEARSALDDLARKQAAVAGG